MEMVYAAGPRALDAPAEHFHSSDRQLEALRHRPSFDQSALSAGFATEQQLQRGNSVSGSFSEPLQLDTSFSESAHGSLPDTGFLDAQLQQQQRGQAQQQQLQLSGSPSAGFTEPPQRLSSSFEQLRSSAGLGGYETLDPGSDIGYLGSPPRNGDLNRTVGSPAARSAVGSPVPGASRLASPPREPDNGSQHGSQSHGSQQQGNQQLPSADGDAQQHDGGGGGNGAPGPVERCKLVILGLPWDTTEETLQVCLAESASPVFCLNLNVPGSDSAAS